MARFNNYGPLDTPLMEEGDTGFARMNARLRPDQLKAGEVALSTNGRMDLDGAWQTRMGVQNFGAALSTNATALTLPFYTYANKTGNSVTRVSTTITIGFATAHSFTTTTLAYVSGITGISPSFVAQNYIITVVNSTSVSITIAGISGTATGTAVVGAPRLEDTIVNAVFGSCLFSDPTSDNDEYIMLATNTGVKAVNVSTGATTNTITYPGGITIDTDVNLLQAFNYLFLFRDGLTTLQFTGTLVGSPAFTLVSNGAYTQPLTLTALANCAISNGVVTISETAHGLVAGNTVRIIDRGTTNLNNLSEYFITTVANANTFTFFATADNITGATVVLGSPQSVGNGFTHMPAPPWAIYHQRRLWMPYYYTMAGSSGSPTITSRSITDEIIASDILDQNTYDQIENNFRIASGGADYVVAIQPFAEDNVVVFNRNTIHLIRGVSQPLKDVSVQEVTREVGCIARKTVVQVGNQILFLSDNGVYSVNFEDLYNLRGASIPMSEAILPLIQRINPDYIANCVATYHDNRYYIAVPLDTSTENNAILIYNFLNQGWESLDIIEQNGWNVREFIRAGAGGLNSLYVVNKDGGIHILDYREDDKDVVNLQIGGTATYYPINSELKTRQYTGGTMDRKRFNSFELQAQSSDSNVSDIEIAFITQNPDSSEYLQSLSDMLEETLPISEDASARGRIGNVRGYGGQFVFQPTIGRPKIRTIKIAAQLTDQGINSKE
jgi:hypothetical protein